MKAAVISVKQSPRVALWSHQITAIAEVRKLLRGGNATLLVSPTGSGKTVMAAEIAKRYKNPLLVAHRLEIVMQARAAGIPAMTIQEALRRKPKGIDLLIIDEAHRSAALTYRKLIERYSGAALLGLTATPLRTDGRGLCDAFSRLVVSSSMSELVDTGHLVPYRAFEAPPEVLNQLPQLKKRGGDYATAELSAMMNRPRLVGNVVREYQKHAAGRKAIVFAVSIEHSKALAKAFNSAGIRALHLDGRASEKTRTAALKALADGDIYVLCNVNLFTEGWDCPSVSCVIMARPTASLTLYLQSVGRGMRVSEGKSDLIILDHAGNIERHRPPNEPRDWSLESDRQKRKHEAEVAELERLYALGFASVEAELEERRRVADSSYSAGAVRGMFRGYISDMQPVSSWLRHRGIEPAFPFAYPVASYRKCDIDELLLKYQSSYSLTDTLTFLNAKRIDIATSLTKRFSLLPLIGHGPSARYAKCDVEKIAGILRAERDETYSLTESAALLGLKPSSASCALIRLGIRAVRRGRYPRIDVDQHRNDGYSSAQAASKLGMSLSSTYWFLKRLGACVIKPGSRMRYRQQEIDAIVITMKDSYSVSEIATMLRGVWNNPRSGMNAAALFLKRNGIDALFSKRGHNSRYPKLAVDKALVAHLRSEAQTASAPGADHSAGKIRQDQHE